MMMFSLLDLLFNLLAVMTAGIMLFAAVVALIALRNGGSIVLLIGSILGLLNSLGWFVFHLMQRSGSLDWSPSFVNGMRVLGAGAWMMISLGVLLLAFSLGAMRRQNRALEGIIAGSQSGHVA